MDVFTYLHQSDVCIQNPVVIYQLNRLQNNEIKLDSIKKAAYRATDKKLKNALELTLAIFQKFQKFQQQ
ncbi:hypothetical protein B5G52_04150 [Pseudoalteromonas sp. A601]|uniref:hypothetical protein n=1 Tax=Pseudoalteromonas sp. A601 TaxID=1967839 RepID=UPI000B3C7972|nr:hypothetical protein [Pseudoalteromonas sp. A601]OUS73445.1 hypothetical protein B5G52_04150 [Pseudoalteromonas sp. A601]